ncbi:MAG: cyanophycinase [Planctomycetota bacterium]
MLKAITLALLLAFVPDLAANDPVVTRKLVIAGGGRLPDVIYERFLELAGDQPRLVLIPTASSEIDSLGLIELWKRRGFRDVHVLHTRDRSRANEAAFVAPLDEATAVWFGGGSQSKIADAYRGTLVETALMKVLRRGGVIGGSSAGAAVQSQIMIAGGRTEPELTLGLGFLRECIIDQHFLERDRIRRSIAAVKAHPEKIGIGIDEGTALIVVDDQATVLGRSFVLRIEIGDGTDVRSYGDGERVPLRLTAGAKPRSDALLPD